MTNRMMFTLSLAMLIAPPAFAQTPSEESPPSVVHVSAEQTEVASAPCLTEVPACCDPLERYWVTGSGVLGWVERSPLPALVTTSPSGTSKANAGILGLSSTSTLFGSDGDVNGGVRAGFSLGGGYWLDEGKTFSVEFGCSMLESEATTFAITSSGNPILARPYVDATTGQQQAVLVAFPSSSTGTIEAESSSGSFIEVHLDFYGNLVNQCGFRLDCLVGYQFYRYDDGLRIGQAVRPSGSTFVPGTQILSVDDFAGENEFNGCDLGLRAEFQWENLTLSTLAKVAAGNLHRDVDINGSQTITTPGAATVVNAGGVYALTSNIGRHGSDDWTVMPEIGATLSWQATRHIRFQLGYSLMMLEDIARASDQVNQIINPNLLPPAQSGASPTQPAFTLNRADIWVQTFNLGLEFRF